ncbi:Abi family protein [Neisseria animalis]|nr:Abi family protein [Neisseria animalis]
MDYQSCCTVFSEQRMQRYKHAVGEESAPDLYRLNLLLSRELFSLVSVFEIALRNKIDRCLVVGMSDSNWLYNSIQPKTDPSLPYQGCFLQGKAGDSAKLIRDVLASKGNIPHDKLVAELGFGFWRYLFAGGKGGQFEATGKVLLKVFPNKPKSTPSRAYNQKWIFDELSKINRFRNRLAHHEPICFKGNAKSTEYAREIYRSLVGLLDYMNIDTAALFEQFGDNVVAICDHIDPF